MRSLKLYLETSVWNFVFAGDAPEKQAVTCNFFDNLEATRYLTYVSETVLLEFRGASVEKYRRLMGLVEKHDPQILVLDSEVRDLADKYIQHSALPTKATIDALHIAYASVHELDFVVSWNLKHIANVTRQERVQGVNFLNGYTKPLQLITPMEVSEYGQR